MGAAHSDTSQGECPQLFFIIPFSPFVSFRQTTAHFSCPEDVLRSCVCVFVFHFLYSLHVHHLPERLSRTERASCAAAAGCAAVKQ